MQISRYWEMPNSKTFQIKAIKNLIWKYAKKDYIIVDPFANECSIRKDLDCKKYISNDLDPEYNTDYHLEAQEFMKLFDNESVDMVLYDPPYSGRQVSECYKKLGKTVTYKDTNSGYFTKFKEEISRIVKPNGIVITCGWNSNGVGMKFGFEMIEVLMVAHGSLHNDTLVTVEKKKNIQKLF